MTRSGYIKKYSATVVKASENTSLFPSLFMAQAILESNNGNSLLAASHNNHFGIKADKSWTGKKVNMLTGEVFDGSAVTVYDFFRVYDNAEDSFYDRVKFLTKNPRYTKAGVFSAKTPQQQADALQAAGYATDPNYASVLKSLIRTNNLETLDQKKK